MIDKIFDEAKAGRWDLYRELYTSLSLKDKQELFHRCYDLFPDQDCSNHEVASEVFDIVCKKIKDPVVVELGCHRGDLAKSILKQYPKIIKWYGYDINLKALQNKVVEDKRFIPLGLETEFYLTNIPVFNIFVCTHTLEHIKFHEVYSCLNKISDIAKIIFIEIPIDKGGNNWSGYTGAHVSDYSINYLKKVIIFLGYDILYESKRKTWISAWIKNKIER